MYVARFHPWRRKYCRKTLNSPNRAECERRSLGDSTEDNKRRTSSAFVKLVGFDIAVSVVCQTNNKTETSLLTLTVGGARTGFIVDQAEASYLVVFGDGCGGAVYHQSPVFRSRPKHRPYNNRASLLARARERADIASN